MKRLFFLVVISATFMIACNQPGNGNNTTGSEMRKDTIFCPPGSSRLDIAKIEQITGMKGTAKNGEYKITVPQNDLNIIVDGFRIIPPMGLGTWTVFTPCKDSVMVMGDIVVTETDLAPVQQEAIRQGFANQCHSQSFCAQSSKCNVYAY